MSSMSNVAQCDQAKGEDLHVVTENGEQCFMWRANQLTYIAQDRQELPLILATKFGQLASKLDLSYNSLSSFKNINLFTNLHELILDNNNFEDHHLEFSFNLRLKTLSMNKNKLVDLYKLINSIKVCHPNLEYLSLIGNPLCPVVGSASVLCAEATSDEFKQTQLNEIIGDSTTAIFNGGIHGIDELILTSDQDDKPDDQSTACLRKGLTFNDFNQQKYRHFIIYHLPNLRFLDSTPVKPSERDEALRRCFWMNRNPAMHLNNRHQSVLEIPLAGSGTDLDGQSEANSAPNSEHVRLTIMTNHQEQPKGAFTRLAYKYTGKNSEGNRFIRNNDL